MPVSITTPKQDYFMQLSAVRDQNINDDVIPTQFVNSKPSSYNSSSPWEPEIQTLYDALKKYDNGTNPNACENCLNKTLWQKKGIEDAGAFDNPDDIVKAFQDSITGQTLTFRPGERNEYVLSVNEGDGRKTEENELFRGGFVPDCPGGEVWHYENSDGLWECSDGIEWTQSVMLSTTEDTVKPSNPDEWGEKRAVSIAFPPYNFKSDLKEYPERIYNHTAEEYQFGQGRRWWGFPIAWKNAPHKSGAGLPDTNELTDLEARCWSDAFDEKPDDFSKYHEPGNITNVTRRMTSSVPDDVNMPVSVRGNLTYKKGFQCKWNYTTSETGKITRLGDQFNLHQWRPTPTIDDDWQNQVSYSFRRASGYWKSSRFDSLPKFYENYEDLISQQNFWNNENFREEKLARYDFNSTGSAVNVSRGWEVKLAGSNSTGTYNMTVTEATNMIRVGLAVDELNNPGMKIGMTIHENSGDKQKFSFQEGTTLTLNDTISNYKLEFNLDSGTATGGGYLPRLYTVRAMEDSRLS